jgi:hypothetical protein
MEKSQVYFPLSLTIAFLLIIFVPTRSFISHCPRRFDMAANYENDDHVQDDLPILPIGASVEESIHFFERYDTQSLDPSKSRTVCVL